MKKVDEILDEVCWDNGYVNFDNFCKQLKHPTSYSHKELFNIIEETAKTYSREAEVYYNEQFDLEDDN